MKYFCLNSSYLVQAYFVLLYLNCRIIRKSYLETAIFSTVYLNNVKQGCRTTVEKYTIEMENSLTDSQNIIKSDGRVECGNGKVVCCWPDLNRLSTDDIYDVNWRKVAWIMSLARTGEVVEVV